MCLKTVPLGEELKEFINKGLRSLDKNDWLKVLKQESGIIELIELLKKSGLQLDLQTTLSDALLVHIKQLRKNRNIESNLTPPRARTLLNVLANHVRLTFLNSLRNELLRDPSLPIDFVIEMFGDEMITLKILEEKADEVIRDLTPGIIERREELELEFLVRLVRESSILEKCKPESKQTFTERLEALKDREDLTEKLKLFMDNIRLDVASSEEVD